MTSFLESPRGGCALHGALRTVQAVGGAVPIVHSNAGCAIQHSLSDRYCELGDSLSVPGSNVIEKQVIFGGASRLREEIKNTINVVNGRLFVVLEGCESAMVGDDAGGMAREAAEQGEPVIHCGTAGFRGDCRRGYERAMIAMIEGAFSLKKRERKVEKRLVNVFGVLPGTDVHFRGDLEEIARLLEGIGLKANIFFGPGDGVAALALAPDAELNLIFSKWGLVLGENLEVRYGTPKLNFPALPTGSRQVREVAEAIAAKIGVSEETTQIFLEGEERRFRHYFRRALDGGIRVSGPVGIVGDERAVIQTGTFLKDDLGAEIAVVAVTDLGEDEPHAALRALGGEIYPAQNGREIHEILIRSGVKLIFGSSLESEAAHDLSAPLVETSYPARGRVVLDKTYTGTRGALRLTEDYLSALREFACRKEKLLTDEIRR
jgi:nitrogenase molybdenum-iron protein beta chain